MTTDVFTPEQRSAVMARVKGKDTGPERAVRAMLTRLGARYRLHRRDLPGSPDIALGPLRLAIFVHGCFWHGHDCPRGARVPRANRDYWLGKIARNRARDAAHRTALEALGWRVETVWECELKAADGVAGRLKAVLDDRRVSCRPFARADVGRRRSMKPAATARAISNQISADRGRPGC